MKIIYLFIIVLLVACNPYRNFKTAQFKAGDKTLALFVPPKYIKQELKTDSAGNTIQVYNYGDGAYLYFAAVKDSIDMQVIDKEKNIAKPHINGGVFYKGVDANGLFWREVQYNNVRYGYKNINGSNEIKFDSAINFVKIIN